MQKKVLIADDHKILRDGLVALFKEQKDFQIVAQTDNGLDAIKLAKQLKPDLVIMDISMPGMNGAEATSRIKASLPDTKILALSMQSDKRFIHSMLKAGASGYLLKDCAFTELFDAIRKILANQIYLSPQIAGLVVEDYIKDPDTDDNNESDGLTLREREVLKLLAEGNTTRKIAGLLNISSKTVEGYRGRVMDKLDIHTVAELTKYAIRAGLTTINK